MLDYANSLGIGFVTAVYPAGQSIDVLMSDDGSRFSNVQVMTFTGSSSTGEVDLPDPGLPSDNSRWNFNAQPERYLRAVIGFCRGAPVCLGFLFPQTGQMTFDQKNRKISRHASDVYTTIDDSGNTELFHPSGAYIRIGTNPAHEDLTGQDVDQLWKISRNTSQAVHIRVAGLNGTTFDIAPNGNVTIAVPQGTVSVTCPAGVSITAPVTITGNVEITGDVGISGGLTVATTGGGTVTFTATVTLNGQLISTGDVTAAGVSLMTHPHLQGTYNIGGNPVAGQSGVPIP